MYAGLLWRYVEVQARYVGRYYEWRTATLIESLFLYLLRTYLDRYSYRPARLHMHLLTCSSPVSVHVHTYTYLPLISVYLDLTRPTPWDCLHGLGAQHNTFKGKWRTCRTAHVGTCRCENEAREKDHMYVLEDNNSKDSDTFRSGGISRKRYVRFNYIPTLFLGHTKTLHTLQTLLYWCNSMPHIHLNVDTHLVEVGQEGYCL